ncbi:hypothetical protein H5410_003651 [Solanum commersonii]|uniref:Uncharacterized protein n=1 Tax=Solanum commersonii TaxID=4109 RepID=A0A9J6B5B5_SOLCO|nr:hypothetical protein H5410_003651 [Solanum commersonii]
MMLSGSRWMEPNNILMKFNEEARRFYDQLEESSRPLCEGSHIGRETCDFYSYYFGHDVSCRRNRPNRNDEGDIDPLFPISIFNQNGRGSKKQLRLHRYGNAISPVHIFCLIVRRFNHMSRTRKQIIAAVYIQGDVDGIGQTIYYGVIQEIIKSVGIQSKGLISYIRAFSRVVEQRIAVVVKSKPGGRIEIDNVLRCMYQILMLQLFNNKSMLNRETTPQHPQHIQESYGSFVP